MPLYLVGLGDAWETPDLILTDLQAEDTITVGDRLVFDARLAAHGRVPGEPVPVVLSEKVGGQLIERGRVTVTPDLAGNRVPITVSHTPLEAGEKTFVLAVPTVAGETDRHQQPDRADDPRDRFEAGAQSSTWKVIRATTSAS